MSFLTLIDTYSQHIISIDRAALILRLETDGYTREIRLKAYQGEFLYALFSKHPHTVSYAEITQLLQNHQLIINDPTRMHRKISEIRIVLENFHPSLAKLILNTRGSGYSLPLRLKKLQHTTSPANTSFKNPIFNHNIGILSQLIDDAIALTENSTICQHSLGYIINHDPIRQQIIEKIAIFNQCEQAILEQLRMHEAEFTSIRIQYLLARLRTYIGLARLSEYPISAAQWLDWFKQEIWSLFEDLKKLLRLTETI